MNGRASSPRKPQTTVARSRLAAVEGRRRHVRPLHAQRVGQLRRARREEERRVDARRAHSGRARHDVRIALREEDDVALFQANGRLAHDRAPAGALHDRVKLDHVLRARHDGRDDLARVRGLRHPGRDALDVVEDGPPEAHGTEQIGEGVSAHRPPWTFGKVPRTRGNVRRGGPDARSSVPDARSHVNSAAPALFPHGCELTRSGTLPRGGLQDDSGPCHDARWEPASDPGGGARRAARGASRHDVPARRARLRRRPHDLERDDRPHARGHRARGGRGRRDPRRRLRPRPSPAPRGARRRAQHRRQRRVRRRPDARPVADEVGAGRPRRAHGARRAGRDPRRVRPGGAGLRARHARSESTPPPGSPASRSAAGSGGSAASTGSRWTTCSRPTS